VGQLNKGWTVGKRLLQFERSGIGGLSGGQRRDVARELVNTARTYLGQSEGRISDEATRERVLRYNIDTAAFRLTVKRVTEESKSSRTPGDTTSIFKLVGATLQRDGAELKRELMGTRGVGWDRDVFEPDELEATREWLWSRTTTIYGGTNEVQRNIIAKRVLGLPD
jgi:alkylation response protein AidB-like acyl-CoA dehydrogenase